MTLLFFPRRKAIQVKEIIGAKFHRYSENHIDTSMIGGLKFCQKYYIYIAIFYIKMAVSSKVSKCF